MSSQDFFLRARRNASLIAFNDVLPANFKLIVNVGRWVETEGVNLRQIVGLEMIPGDPLSKTTDIHYNLRLTPTYVGWDNLFIQPGDPDYEEPTFELDGTPIPTTNKLDNTTFKRWFRNNGGERLDDVSEHPRSGRTMRWWRWTDGIERLDVTIDLPEFLRRVWA